MQAESWFGIIEDMRRSVSRITAAALMITVAGCVGRTTAMPFNVVVRGPAMSCSIEVDGRNVTLKELLAIAEPAAKAGRRARIDTNMAEPYRCLAGAIYLLQMSGFTKVPVVAVPPANGR